jgi:hypothetical protein
MAMVVVGGEGANYTGTPQLLLTQPTQHKTSIPSPLNTWVRLARTQTWARLPRTNARPIYLPTCEHVQLDAVEDVGKPLGRRELVQGDGRRSARRDKRAHEVLHRKEEGNRFHERHECVDTHIHRPSPPHKFHERRQRHRK